jgi:3-oxoacyl-[acyl-carrier protein] reductase
MTDDRVLLVTGARKGIGRHLAEHYSAAGWRVVGVSREEAAPLPARYRHVCADVEDEPAIIRLMAGVRATEGRLDAVVNCAGVAAMNHALLTPASTVRRILGTNVVGTFTVAREAAKLMSRARTGRIVNLSTVAVPLDLEGEAAYAASKAAVESLTRTMAREFAPLGITVNALGPTPIKTDLIRGVPAEALERLISRQPLKRLGTMADVVNVVEFFLRPESAFITGQTLYLGGVA